VTRRRLRSRVRALYFGHTQAAVRFQGVLLVLDVLIIGFFIGSQFIREQTWFWIVDAAIATFVAIDLTARLFAFGTLRRWVKYPTTWVDLIVLATLALPTVLHNWGFLRVLRLWTLVHSERFWNVLARGKWDDTYVEDIAKAVTTLVVFVFIAAGLTQALFLGQHAQLNNFIDAMYFVVTSLTTTGYGDITLASPFGRLFTIGLMLVGISLFFTIAQKVFAPQQKIQRCLACGRDRHGLDARYCCSCGTELTAPLRGRARAARSAHGKGG
jgi:voltage-gated potassium channel